VDYRRNRRGGGGFLHRTDDRVRGQKPRLFGLCRDAEDDETVEKTGEKGGELTGFDHVHKTFPYTDFSIPLLHPRLGQPTGFGTFRFRRFPLHGYVNYIV
jgi:hypothetical protein